MSAEPGRGAEQFDSPAQQRAAATLGMWIFLGTELMFFGPLLLGYAYGRLRYPAAFAAASRHTEVWLGTLNTALLLTSSLLMALAAEARPDARQRARRLLWGVAALGAAFLVVKGIEYRHEWQEHLFPGAGFAFPDGPPGPARLFYILYFAMTGLHALHLSIGIAAVALFALALRRRPDFAAPDRIEVTALYWHFVDVVWIFLYPILYLTGRSG